MIQWLSKITALIILWHLGSKQHSTLRNIQRSLLQLNENENTISHDPYGIFRLYNCSRYISSLVKERKNTNRNWKMLPNRTCIEQKEKQTTTTKKRGCPHGSCRVYKNKPCDLILELSFQNAAEQVWDLNVLSPRADRLTCITVSFPCRSSFVLVVSFSWELSCIQLHYHPLNNLKSVAELWWVTHIEGIKKVQTAWLLHRSCYPDLEELL